MTLWSIIPEEIVLDNVSTPTVYEEIECNNMKMLVEKISPTQCKVSRLLTTNPQDYLRPEIQPGSILTYRLVLE
ncbi:YlzJ-like family protein [Pelosinus sp. UFO1]|jgi:hypothetical protein|uniref:YlzJ-like family protein n=1 Tax=Pelosinus sp. UFO1 TaxID=484770 RepID=UPI0004D0EC5E|nr:YlzJ-like family protein [Pelosinus sp. UFO1]AIF51726.1 YlzJ-like protein [Pelosinus sp. UFO1]